MQTVRIKQFPTSKETQTFYIDPNFFVLLKRPAHGNHQDLLKKIAENIAHNYSDQPELYLDRIIKNNDGSYKILVHDCICVKPIIIHLSELPSDNEFDTHITEELNYPDELNPNSPINRDNGWLASNLADGIHRFEQACPTAPLIFSDKDYSIEQAAKVFTGLKEIADLNKHFQVNDETFCQHLQMYNSLFKKAVDIDPIPRDERIEELFDQIIKESNQKQKQINETLNTFANEFADKYAKFSNTQENINCIKVFLAWAVHHLASQCYQASQLPADKPFPQDKIEAFNKHFEDVIRITQPGLTDVKEVCQTFANWSIEEIDNFINRIISAPYDETIGWNADKQNNFIKNINDKAESLKLMLEIDTAPFNAWHKRISFKSAGFSLKESKKYESNNQAILTEVKTLCDNPKYQALKQINFQTEERLLAEVTDKLKKYQMLIDDYKKLLGQQEKIVGVWKTKKEELRSCLDLSKLLTKTKDQIKERIQEIENDLNSFVIPTLADEDALRKEQMDTYQHEMTCIQEKIDMMIRKERDLEFLAEVQRELEVVAKDIEINYGPLEMDVQLLKGNRQLGDEFRKHKNSYNAARAQFERLKRKFFDYPPLWDEGLRNILIDAQKNISKSFDEIKTHYRNMQALLQSQKKAMPMPPPDQGICKDKKMALEDQASQTNLPILDPPIKDQETQTLESPPPPMNIPKKPAMPAKPPSDNDSHPGFFKRYGSGMLIGTGVALGLGVLTVMALSGLGLAAEAVTEVAKAAAQVATKLTGTAVSETAGSFMGFGAISAGLASLGAFFGGLASKISNFMTKSPSPGKDDPPGDNKPGIDSEHEPSQSYSRNSHASIKQQLGKENGGHTQPLPASHNEIERAVKNYFENLSQKNTFKPTQEFRSQMPDSPSSTRPKRN